MSESTTSTSARLAILWSFARPYLHILIFGLVLSLAVSAMGLASPMVTKWVLDTLAVGGSLRDPVLLLVGLLILGAVVGWFQWVMLGRLAEDIVYDARKRMILRYLGARVFALLSRGPGELVTRVTSDTVLLNQAASSSIIGLINGVIMIIGSLVLMAGLDLVLLGTTLAALAVVLVLFVVLMPRISKVEEKAQAALSDLGSELEGTVRAIKTVKSSSAEPRRFSSLMGHVGESRRFSMKSVRIQAAAWTVAGGWPGRGGHYGAGLRRLPGLCRGDDSLRPGRLPALRLGSHRAVDGADSEPHHPAVRYGRRRPYRPDRGDGGRGRGSRCQSPC